MEQRAGHKRSKDDWIGSPSPGFRASGLERLVVVMVLCATAFVHARFILAHFSSDGYLIDSGWFAFLFESADPWLRNPVSVNRLSYYAHHLSPYIFVFGAPLAVFFGLDGFEIFALHQGIFFALFFFSLYLIASAAPAASKWHRVVAIFVAIVIGCLSAILFQAAAYPHFEIALLSVTSLALAGYLRGSWPLFAGCLLLLPAIREDGGFYAALACLLGAATTHGLWPRRDRRLGLLLVLALAGVLAGMLSMYLKGRLFPGYEAFAGNFSGYDWRHLSFALVTERLVALAARPSLAAIVLGTLALAAWDRRYAAGLLLLSPLLLLHLVAVRDELAQFRLYYALPWLLACAGWLAVFVRRAQGPRSPSVAERVALVVVAVLLASPTQAAFGVRDNFWAVAVDALVRPVADLRKMRQFVVERLAVARSGEGPAAGGVCVSLGIAALVPDHLAEKEVVPPEADLAGCGHLLLLRGDMHYGPLAARAEAAGFLRVAATDNAEYRVPSAAGGGRR